METKGFLAWVKCGNLETCFVVTVCLVLNIHSFYHLQYFFYISKSLNEWQYFLFKGLYRVWANFGPQKLLSSFGEIVGIILKYRMCNIPLEIWHSLKYVHNSDIWHKKIYDFSIIVKKIVRKGAYFYLFFFPSNIERHRKQEYKSCLQSRTTLLNLKTNVKYDFFWHKWLKTVNCVISEVILLE